MQKKNPVFTKVIADMAIFLEFTSAESLNEDVAIGMMEQLAATLGTLDEEKKLSLAAELKEVSTSYPDEKILRFVRDLPESFGLM